MQGDLSKSKRYAGTGIGLTICRSLVKQMGGELQLVSEVGVGSTFSFSIPLRLP